MRALVTGAGKRLGRAMALHLAQEGYDVAVHYASSGEAAAEVVAEIRSLGRKSCSLQADLLAPDAARALLPQAAAALGGEITCLINNASIFEPDRLQNASDDSWNRHFGSNLRAPFLLIQAMAKQALAPVRDAQGEPRAAGLVVNMVDQKIRSLTPDFMTYTLAKSALWTLTQTAAQELAPRLRVNAIGPGPTLANPYQAPEEFAKQRASTILKRGANAGDITGALSYLLAAPAVTGQLICVDGGQHLVWENQGA